LVSDPEAEWVLQDEDVVRIELGVHIDGYIAQVAHTVFLGATKVFHDISLIYCYY
jgi:methionine aminopeptidase